MYRQRWKNSNGDSPNDSSDNDMMYPSPSTYPQHHHQHHHEHPTTINAIRLNGEGNNEPPNPLRVFYRQPTSILRARFFSKTSLALGLLFVVIIVSSRLISNFIIVRTITTSTKADLLAEQLKYIHDQQQIQASAIKSQNQPVLIHVIHTTDETSFKKHNILAMESIFYHHPKAQVILHVPPLNLATKGAKEVEVETVAEVGVISTAAGQQDEQKAKRNNIDAQVELMMTDEPIRPLINAGYNATLRKLDIGELLQNVVNIQDTSNTQNSIGGSQIDTTKIIEFINRISQYEIYAPNWYVDVSDLARLLLLYIYGGIYLDTDVIVVKPLVDGHGSGGGRSVNSESGTSTHNDHSHYASPLPNNVLAWEQQEDDYDKSMSKEGDKNHKLANGAIMKFLHPQNEFLADCINEYMTTYQVTNKWGYNGPQLLTRVFLSSKTIQRSSGGSSSNMKYSKCELQDQYDDYTVDECPIIMLPKSTFYPLSWWRINEVCFQNPAQFHLYKPMIDSMSYVVHINNKISNTMWERYDGKLIPGTVCDWLYTSYCVLCNSNSNSVTKATVANGRLRKSQNTL